ncbi:MAG: ATP-binding protein, partial [Gemmatimonadota bacterium]|nr:ATP-binding protein [Gemmatimonadota bacterium]
EPGTLSPMADPHPSRSLDTAPREPLGAGSLRLLAEITGYLSAGLGSEGVLAAVASALGRGLSSESCRVWVRTPDGSHFRAIIAEGAPQPADVRSDESEPWFRASEAFRLDGGRWHARLPLIADGERLGVLEVNFRDGAEAGQLREILAITANVLAPLIGSFELSEDLASEIALRTREIESQRRFTSKIIDSLPVGIYVVDNEYRIQAWNRKREMGNQGLDREEVIGRVVFDVLHRQPRDMLKQEFDRAFTTGEMTQIDVESSALGDPRYYRLTKVPMRLDNDDVTHVITIGEDITEWKRVQDHVFQSEKLSAVGQLAAGVMHEINNPLATIGACVEALTMRAESLTLIEAQGFEEYLRIIESELERCKSIVDGLLDFSRPKARVKRPAELNQVVEDALFLVKHHDRFRGITLERHLADDLPVIEANHEQLIQVFLSIMLNAIDAMEGKGTLSVRTGRFGRKSEVVVAIGDTGMGIRRDDLPKIFEPFFTTKQPGSGTGLGLSICYGIVQEHGGRVLVDSQVGRGSVFHVVLPVKSPEPTA